MTLLEWARTAGARYVQVSTDEVYGDLEAGGRALETTRCARQAPTAPQRQAATCKYLRMSVPTASTRPSRAAPTPSSEPVPEEARAAVRHERARRRAAPRLRDGEQVREWLHAEDHCAGIDLVLREGAAGEIYNVGGEDHQPRGDVPDPRAHRRRRVADPACRGPRGTRPPLRDRRHEARSLGWAPVHSFGEGGLPETIEWYRGNRSWWEPIKSGEYRRYYEEQYAERLEA